MLARPSPALNPQRVIVIAASAGGIRALISVLSMLPPDFPAPIIIVQHRALAGESHLVAVLGRKTQLTVVEATDGDALQAGTVYVARADHHLTVTGTGRLAYVNGRPIRHLLSSANPLFASCAETFGADAIAIVLSGSGRDGADGVLAIKAHGGTVIAQDEATAEHFGMPRAAIESGAVDMVLPVETIAATLLRLTAAAAPGTRTGTEEGTRP